MKPQLIMAELGGAGFHNQNSGLTQKRLAKSAAWKKQRIVTMIPAGQSIPVKVYMSHKNLAFPPNNGVCHWAALGTEVGEAYSNAIEQIIAHPELGTWEYILTIEHDNMPPLDGVIKLLEAMEANPKYDCIGGLYYTKGYGGVPQIWGDPKDPVLNFRPQMPDPNGGLVECNGTGMGFNLWRMKMFRDKKLRRPWFTTQTKNGVATQDLHAWSDFKKHGYRCAIDCSVRVGHYDSQHDIIW